MKKAYILVNRQTSKDATDFYLDIVRKALILKEYNVELGFNYFEAIRCDLIVTVDAKDTVKVLLGSIFMFRRPKIISWFQGVVPEEAFYIFKSHLRKIFWEFFEIISLVVSDYIIFVSRSMREHYESKYSFLGIRKKNNIVIPCVNKRMLNPLLLHMNKSLSFCYAGSLSGWQKFPEICDIYKRIERKLPEASFLVLTSEVEKAKSIVKGSKINNYVIKYVDYKDIDVELVNCKYGFVIRDDHIVNRVATPTKISGYLANGVVPIISEWVGDYKSSWVGRQEVIFTDNEADALVAEILKHHAEVKLDVSSFSRYFEEDFDVDGYIEALVEGIKL